MLNTKLAADNNKKKKTGKTPKTGLQWNFKRDFLTKANSIRYLKNFSYIFVISNEAAGSSG